MRRSLVGLALLVVTSAAIGQTQYISGGGSTAANVSINVAPAPGMTSSGGPITGSGTITLGWGSGTQNLILATPCSGAGAAVFRLLCAADIPTISESQVSGLATDLASKQPAGNYITALSGDATASGPGAVGATVKQAHWNVTPISAASSPYTVAASNSVIVCDASAGPVIINLPAATGCGRAITVKKTDSTSNACSPTAAGADRIDGSASYSLTSQNAASAIWDTASGSWSRMHVGQLGGDLTGITSNAALTAFGAGAGSCSHCSLTVDTKGRVQAYSSGDAVTCSGCTTGTIPKTSGTSALADSPLRVSGSDVVNSGASVIGGGVYFHSTGQTTSDHRLGWCTTGTCNSAGEAAVTNGTVTAFISLIASDLDAAHQVCSAINGYGSTNACLWQSLRLTGGLSVISRGHAVYLPIETSDMVVAASSGGSYADAGTKAEVLTLSTSTSTTNTSGNLAPAASRIKAILYRVNTTISTATAFTISIAGGNPFCSIGSSATSQTGLASGTTGVLVPCAWADQFNSSAATLAVTTTGTPSAGALSLAVQYESYSPPTS